MIIDWYTSFETFVKLFHKFPKIQLLTMKQSGRIVADLLAAIPQATVLTGVEALKRGVKKL